METNFLTSAIAQPNSDGEWGRLTIESKNAPTYFVDLTAEVLSGLTSTLLQLAMQCGQVKPVPPWTEESVITSGVPIPARRMGFDLGAQGSVNLVLDLGMFHLAFAVPSQSIADMGRRIVKLGLLAESEPPMTQ